MTSQNEEAEELMGELRRGRDSKCFVQGFETYFCFSATSIPRKVYRLHCQLVLGPLLLKGNFEFALLV